MSGPSKPRAMGVRGWSLLIPSLLSAIGLFCFAVLAYSFTELQSLSVAFRRALVIAGAFSLAAGGEIGTLATVVDIYRKDGPRTWDWLALFFSLCTTVASFILAFAALLLRNVAWVPVFLDWGAVALGVLAALDAYGGFMEFGLYLNSYDARLEQWERTAQAEHERHERMRAILNEDTQPLKRVAPQRPKPRSKSEQLLSLFRENPEMSQRQAAARLGISVGTVNRYLREAIDAGKARRSNGKVEVK